MMDVAPAGSGSHIFISNCRSGLDMAAFDKLRPERAEESSSQASRDRNEFISDRLLYKLISNWVCETIRLKWRCLPGSEPVY
jgi:hypothetical protein